MKAAKRNPLASGLLAALSLLAGLATAVIGVLPAPVALVAVGRRRSSSCC